MYYIVEFLGMNTICPRASARQGVAIIASFPQRALRLLLALAMLRARRRPCRTAIPAIGSGAEMPAQQVFAEMCDMHLSVEGALWARGPPQPTVDKYIVHEDD